MIMQCKGISFIWDYIKGTGHNKFVRRGPTLSGVRGCVCVCVGGGGGGLTKRPSQEYYRQNCSCSLMLNRGFFLYFCILNAKGLAMLAKLTQFFQHQIEEKEKPIMTCSQALFSNIIPRVLFQPQPGSFSRGTMREDPGKEVGVFLRFAPVTCV